MELSERSRQILDFERSWRALPGTKAAAIRERFGVSDSRYYQLLKAVLDEPGVAAYDPLVVKRLRRRFPPRRLPGARRSLRKGHGLGRPGPS